MLFRVKCIVGLDPWLFALSEQDFEHGIKAPVTFIVSHEYEFFFIHQLFRIFFSEFRTYAYICSVFFFF